MRERGREGGREEGREEGREGGGSVVYLAPYSQGGYTPDIFSSVSPQTRVRPEKLNNSAITHTHR